MSEFWIQKYRPKKTEEFVGKVLGQIESWINNHKKGKGLLLHGPTGTGKTLSVELMSDQKNLQFVRLEPNESRNKEVIESLISGSKSLPLFYKGKIILIDELESLSGKDRGALSLIVELIKESKFPVILITIDPYITKLANLRKYCDMIKFSSIPSPSINKKLKEICKAEGIEIDDEITKSLSRFSSGDLRTAINDLEAICKGRKEIKAEDMETLGYREKELSVFNVLPSLFRAKNIQTNRNIIQQTDKDPDEIFWWIESNLTKEFQGKDIIHAYDVLSKADLYRGLVSKQQNWRFKAIASDIICGISLNNKSTGFTMYRPPDRFLKLARSKMKREAIKSMAESMGKKLHCSNRIIIKEYLPYMDLFLKRNPEIQEQLGLKSI